MHAPNPDDTFQRRLRLVALMPPAAVLSPGAVAMLFCRRVAVIGMCWASPCRRHRSFLAGVLRRIHCDAERRDSVGWIRTRTVARSGLRLLLTESWSSALTRVMVDAGRGRLRHRYPVAKEAQRRRPVMSNTIALLRRWRHDYSRSARRAESTTAASYAVLMPVPAPTVTADAAGLPLRWKCDPAYHNGPPLLSDS